MRALFKQKAAVQTTKYNGAIKMNMIFKEKLTKIVLNSNKYTSLDKSIQTCSYHKTQNPISHVELMNS